MNEFSDDFGIARNLAAPAQRIGLWSWLCGHGGWTSTADARATPPASAERIDR